MRIITIVLVFLFAIAVLYLLVGFQYYRNQERFVYFPLRQIVRVPSDLGMDYQDLYVLTEDGVRIHAWMIEQPEDRPLILVFQGNGGNISYGLEFAESLYRSGFSLMLMDYRGYGRSEGTPTEEGTYLDSEAAWDHLVHTAGYNPRDIILLGRSLGGPIAARLASIEDPGGLILDSTFTSLKDIGAQAYPILPVRKFLKYEYDTLSFLEKTQAPVLIIHSTEDELVSFTHAQKLFESVGSRKELVKIQGTHNSAFFVSEPTYLEAVKDFIHGN